MVEFKNIKPLPLLFMFVLKIFSIGGAGDLGLEKINTPKNLYREDLRCGSWDFKASNGKPAICPINNPCCSAYFFCGKGDAHCNCSKCIDHTPTKNDTVIFETLPTNQLLTPLDQLTALIQELSGPVPKEEMRGEEKTHSNTFSNQVTPMGEGAETDGKSETKKRFIPTILSRALPHLTKFGAGLIKNSFSQLVNRKTKNGYTQAILKNFIPRAISTSNLRDSAIEKNIQTNIKNNNYGGAISVIDSYSQDRDEERHISDKYKKVFKDNVKDRKVTNSVRHILKALTSTFDSILSQRLTSLSNLLTSLFTSLIEALRILLVDYHNGHANDLKYLLHGNNDVLDEVKKLRPASNVPMFSLHAATLVLIALIFPTLFALRSSMIHSNNKLLQSRPRRNAIRNSVDRRGDRIEQDVEEEIAEENNPETGAEVLTRGSSRRKSSTFSRREPNPRQNTTAL